MKIQIKDLLQTIVSLGLGLIIFYLVYKQLDIAEMKKLIGAAKWQYLLIPIILCILSSVVRALRWNMLIAPIDHQPKLKNTFCAVMYGYFINHLLPRAGEIARCGVLKKYEGISFSQLVGTVISERAVDMLVTLLIVGITVICEFNVFSEALSRITIGQTVFNIISNPILWIAIAALFVLLFALRHWIMQMKIVGKFKEMVKGVWLGLKSITQVKNKPLFIIYSLTIFVIYFLMLYCSFWVFDFTAHLGLAAGLTTYVFGALGMVVPVQGGIGTYEFMTIQALTLYGISMTQAGTFAVLAHLVEIIVNSVVGFGCSLLLPFLNKTKE